MSPQYSLDTRVAIHEPGVLNLGFVQARCSASNPTNQSKLDSMTIQMFRMDAPSLGVHAHLPAVGVRQERDSMGHGGAQHEGRLDEQDQRHQGQVAETQSQGLGARGGVGSPEHVAIVTNSLQSSNTRMTAGRVFVAPPETTQLFTGSWLFDAHGTVCPATPTRTLRSSRLNYSAVDAYRVATTPTTMITTAISGDMSENQRRPTPCRPPAPQGQGTCLANSRCSIISKF